MTINLSDNIPRQEYTVAQGVTQTAFVVSFEWFDDIDLNVYVNGVLQTLATDYTTAADAANTLDHVSGSDGYVHFVEDVTGISGGTTVVITRSIDIERTTDFPASGAFQIDALNVGLDKIIGMTADIDNVSNRSLRLKDYDVTATDMTIPVKADRAGRVLGFNETTGQPQAGPEIADVESLAAVTADIARLADIEDGTLATDAIQTVAGISGNVTTVSGISGNVTTVAGISSNVTTVADNTTNINTVAGNTANINTVSGINSDVTTVAGIAADVTAAATNASDITTIADEVAKVITVANDLNEAVSEIDTVANSIANVDLVGGSIANVNTVASNLTDVNAFAETYFVSATEPSSPTLGDLWFDTTNNIMKVYGSGGFVNAGSSVNGTANRYAWTVGTASGTYTGSTTVFPATYDAGYVDVYLNGVKLLVGTDVTATNGADVTLTTAAATDDIVEIVAYGTFTSATALSLGDNEKIQLGASQDLQIYHDGSHSYIDEAGTGDIYVSVLDDVIFRTYGTNELVARFNTNQSTGGWARLYHRGSQRLETTDSGIDVTGSVTANDIAISDTSPTFSMTDTDTNALFRVSASSAVGSVTLEVDENGIGSNPQFLIQGQNVNRFRIDADSGDISFNNGAGTNAKFFWDASEEALGIGTASLNTYGGKLNVTSGAAGGETTLVVANNNANQFVRVGINGDVAQIAYDNADSLAFGITTDSTTSGLTTEHMRITSTGLVGIGTNLPTHPLTIQASGTSGNSIKILGDSTNSSGRIMWRNNSDTGEKGRIAVDTSSNMTFHTGSGGTERLRILSSGGITFNGETSAAHALDDYEEGTWTPEVRTSGGDVLSASTSGRFTKIGRLVHLTGDLVNINTTGGTSTNPVRAYDLPFTVDVDLTFGSCLSSVVTFQNGRTQLTARANTSEFIEFFANGSAQGYTPIDVGDLSSGVSDLVFSISYYTDQ